jgi:hypothetical protein
MPKYYVQSGTLQLLTTATDPRAAAVWAVHRTLAPSLPFLSGEPAPQSLPPSASLEESICVSQRGFAGDDRLEYPTLAVVAEWTQLLVAVDRLQSRLALHC